MHIAYKKGTPMLLTEPFGVGLGARGWGDFLLFLHALIQVMSYISIALGYSVKVMQVITTL